MTDLDAARRFVHGHARLLERRRLEHAFDGAPAELVLAALTAYRNPDGGIGALEPDLRTPASQPLPTRSALAVLAGLPATGATRAMALGALDWLATVSGADGGVPFVLPSGAEQPAAPWLTPSPGSSLLATAQLAAAAHRLGLAHPWLDRADGFCWAHLRDPEVRDGYTFAFVVDLLDATPERARADAELDVLAALVPADGRTAVAGGVEGEHVDPLIVAPRPDHAGARLFAAGVLDRALDALEDGQRDDGGWDFSWGRWNPAAAWEWRGVVTVEALLTLRSYGRL